MDRIIFLDSPHEVRWKVSSEWASIRAQIAHDVNYFKVWTWLDKNTVSRVGIFYVNSDTIRIYFEDRIEHDDFVMQAKLCNWFDRLESPVVVPARVNTTVTVKPNLTPRPSNEDDMRESVGVYHSKNE